MTDRELIVMLVDILTDVVRAADEVEVALYKQGDPASVRTEMMRLWPHVGYANDTAEQCLGLARMHLKATGIEEADDGPKG